MTSEGDWLCPVYVLLDAVTDFREILEDVFPDVPEEFDPLPELLDFPDVLELPELFEDEFPELELD